MKFKLRKWNALLIVMFLCMTTLGTVASANPMHNNTNEKSVGNKLYFSSEHVKSVSYGERIAKWTFIWYLDEDNSLNGAGFYGDVQEAIHGFNPNANGKVNVIVLDDKNKSGDTKLYYVNNTGAHDISLHASSWLRSEMDMGDPLTLVNFVLWTVENYPAEHYFLDMWDHGGDYFGAMQDETNHSIMNLGDLREAAETIYYYLGFPIDIWGYDACLMDSGADNYQIKQAANIIVASEHTEGGDGWDYDALISNLTDNPNQTPEQYAYNLVEHVDDETGRTSIVTMAAINTTKWDFWFMQAYNELAQAIRQKAGSENSNIKNAFSDTVSADAESEGWPSGKDVADFASQLLSHVSDEKIKYWAERVLENASSSVINYYDVDTSGRKRIMAETDSISDLNSSFRIFNETEWDEMLYQVYYYGTDDNNQEPTCQITSPDNGLMFVQPATIVISGKAQDPDGSISRVEVKIDRGDWVTVSGTDTWSYSINSSILSPGKHYVFVRAYDGDLYSVYSHLYFYVLSTPQKGTVRINGNEDFTKENGVVKGMGTKDDPYVISNMYIDAHGAEDAFYIGNTTSYFILSNCVFENATIGVEIYNVTHGTVYNDTLSDNEFGMYILYSMKVNVLHNHIFLNRMGIYISSSMYIALKSNSMSYNGVIIEGRYVENWNTMFIDTTNKINGKPLYYWKNRTGGTVPSDAGEVILANCTDIEVFNENLSYATVGVEAGFSRDIIVYESNIENNVGGIYLFKTNNSELKNNALLSNQMGIVLSFSENNILYNNSINSGVGKGIYFESSDKNVVSKNIIENYSDFGMYIYSGNNNSIYGNIFYNNHGSQSSYNSTHIQACDFGHDNRWNTSQYGNYWLDWAENNDTNDNNHDGFVDWPYYIFGYSNAKDYHPLKNRPVVSVPLYPRNLKATVGYGYVNLTWEKPMENGGSKIMEYRIYCNGTLIATVPASQLWYNDTNVVNGETYTFYITAVNSVGEGDKSKEIQATTSSSVPELSAFYMVLVILIVALLGFKREF